MPTIKLRLSHKQNGEKTQIETKGKVPNCYNLKSYFVTKVKKNCDTIQNHKVLHNLTQIKTTLKNRNCNKTLFLNYDKNKKLKF